MSFIDNIKSKLSKNAASNDSVARPEPVEKFETIEDFKPHVKHAGVPIMIASDNGTRLYASGHHGIERDALEYDFVFDKDGKFVGTISNVNEHSQKDKFVNLPELTEEQRKQYAHLVDINIKGVHGTNGHPVVTTVSEHDTDGYYAFDLNDDKTITSRNPKDGSDGVVVNVYSKNKNTVMSKAESDLDASKTPEERMRDAGIILPSDDDKYIFMS